MKQSDSGAVTTPFASKFTAPSLAELATHFPQLELLEFLGQGGMGAVYKAKQIRLDRVVALKILPKTAGQEAEFANRFAREAKTMARLNHPNIVAIHDYGETGGWFFFIMEYIDGVNLRQAIQARNVEPAAALSLVGQVCDALQYAHEEGVVHRDIKPENILLDKRGRVKIADFGLAKLLGHVTMNDRLTHTHQVMGTVGYMAPEQMEGSKEIDHRADLYALGVVFYELLTNELPLGRFAPPSQKVRIDVRIDEVVLKTLEKEPQRRYQQASMIKEAVEQISKGAGPAAPPASFALPTGSNMIQSMPWLLNPTAAGVALLVLGVLEFGLFFMGMFQMTELHFRYSDTNKTWMLFTMADLFAGSAVAVAGLLILWRRFWLLAMLGAIVAIVPLAPLASFLRTGDNESSLEQLIGLAEKQGIKWNTSDTRNFTFDARMLRDKILNLADSPENKMHQLIYLRWPTILATWLSIPVGIWALVLLFKPAVRTSFRPWYSLLSGSGSESHVKTEVHVEPRPQDQSLLLGFHALIAIVTLGLGAAFVVWPCSALITGQMLRLPFGTKDAGEIAWIFAPIGMGFIWFGIKMLNEVLHVIGIRSLDRTLRMQLFVMAAVFLTAGLVLSAKIYMVLHEGEDMYFAFARVINNGSEAAGWLFGFFVGGGVALLIALAPLSSQKLWRVFRWFALIVIIAVALAFVLLPTTIKTIR